MKITTQRNILLVLSVILIFLMMRSFGDSSIQINTLKQNIFSLNDSLRTYKDKTGQIVHEKGALISEKKELEKLNKELAKEIKYLKDNPLDVECTCDCERT